MYSSYFRPLVLFILLVTYSSGVTSSEVNESRHVPESIGSGSKLVWDRLNPRSHLFDPTEQSLSSHLTSMGTQDENTVFYNNFDYDIALEAYGYDINLNSDPNMIAETRTSAASNGSRGLYFKSTPNGAVNLYRDVNIDYTQNMTLGLYAMNLGTSGCLRITLESYNIQMSLDYGQHSLIGWEPDPIFDVGISFPVNMWYKLEQNLNADIEAALEHPSSPFSTFKPTRITRIEFFQDGDGTITSENYFDEIIIMDQTDQTDQTSSEYIDIVGNGEFYQAASLAGWEGNGTEVAPFIIEGLDLISSPSYDNYWPLISIQATDVYFDIRNCDFYNIDNHIVVSLSQVKHVKIVNLSIKNSSQSFQVTNSQNIEIINNSIKDNNQGISIEDSSNITVRNNLINNSGGGITITGSPESHLENNTISNNHVGITLISSDESAIISNKLLNNGEGINLHDSGHSLVLSNTIVSDGGYGRNGIGFFNSSNCRVKNNVLVSNGINFDDYFDANYSMFHDFANNTVNGKELLYFEKREDETIAGEIGQIILFNCSQIAVTGVNLSSTSTGLLAINSVNITIQDSTITNNIRAIRLINTGNSSVINNTISQNEEGIQIINSDNSTLRNNYFFAARERCYWGWWWYCSSNQGIYVTNSHNSQISNNVIDNGGIEVSESDVNHINGNSITNGSYVNFWNSLNSTFSNNYINGSHTIEFQNSQYFSILNNQIQFGEGDGLRLYECQNGDIRNNRIKNNSGFGIIIHSFGSNVITNNQLLNNLQGGIRLIDSARNIIKHNIFSDSGLSIEGYEAYYFLQDEVENNTIDGKSILYLAGLDGYTVPDDVGQIIIGNSDSIVIDGLGLSTRDTPITMFNCNSVTISNNYISTTQNAMYLAEISNVKILDNTITSEDDQIILLNSDDVLIQNNQFYKTSVLVLDSVDIDISKNQYREGAIRFQGVSGSSIDKNYLNASSIELSGSNFIKIKGNTIAYSYGDAILLSDSDDNEISGNTVHSTEWNGIFLTSSRRNSITGNMVSNSNNFAIYLERSRYNEISWNDFVNSQLEECSNSASVGCISQAYSTSSANFIVYNHWNDWTKPDKNLNCVVDSLYPIIYRNPFNNNWEISDYDKAPLSRSIAKGSAEGELCKVLAEFSTYALKNPEKVIGFSILVLILASYLIFRRVRSWRRKTRKLKNDKLDLYPNDNSNS
ncbi:MAG: right-handed parallel beta-helix repeat-containing protein [Candidatus Kariarchaeaceae archaeon]